MKRASRKFKKKRPEDETGRPISIKTEESDGAHRLLQAKIIKRQEVYPMREKKYLLGALIFFLALGLAYAAGAQDSPQKNEGKATIEGKAGDTNFDIRVQGGEREDRARPAPGGLRGA